MAFEIKKAKRQRRPLKINLEGVSGSGKTYTALRLAFAMRRAGIGKKIIVADSENESAGLYDGVAIDGETWEYDVCPMPIEKQNPTGYTEAYEYLVSQGFDIIIGDSLTHAWYGAQEIVDKYAAANRNDKFGGWAKVTPQQRKMLATLTDSRAHFISTMRVKSEYDRVSKDGGSATVIKKVGTKTDQREGAEYEFDCVARLDKGDIPTDHEIIIEKVRGCTAMDGRRGVNPGPDFWKPLFDWWLSAEPVKSREDELADALALSITATRSIDELKKVMTAVNAEAKAGHITPAHIARLTAVKDARKAVLDPPTQVQTPAPKPTATAAPEGEQRADFPAKSGTQTSTTAATTATATPSPASTAAATPVPATKPTSDPVPKPAPAAEHRTAPPPKLAEHPAQRLLSALQECGSSWPEVRDCRGEGEDLSNEAGLGKLPPGARVTDLTGEQVAALWDVIGPRIEAKKRRASVRAANKARREAEAAAEEVSAS